MLNFKRAREKLEPLASDVRLPEVWESVPIPRQVLRVLVPTLKATWFPVLFWHWRKEMSCLVCGAFVYNAKRHFFAPPGELVEEWMAGRKHTEAQIKLTTGRDGVLRRIVASTECSLPTLWLWRYSSTVSGCYTCRIVVAAIESIAPAWLQGDIEGRHVEAVSPPLEIFKREMPVQVLLVDTNKEDISERYFRLDIFRKLGDPMVFMPGMLGVAGVVSRTNTESLAEVRGWLDSCTTWHERCRGAVLGTPVRLIDVGDPDSTGLELIIKKYLIPGVELPVEHCLDALAKINVPCRLIEAHEEPDLPNRQRYIALSYCWGTAKEQWLTTTVDTIEAHRQSIPWRTAPKTIRDAVLITRFLGIRYLWIDALCIMQGDLAEWLSEGARMSEIYSGAFLVVAGTTTADCTEGILNQQVFGQDLWQKSFPLPRVAKRFHPRSHDRRSLHVRKGTQQQRHRVFSDDVIVAGRTRAWMYQEMLFARRILYVSRFEMLWRCSSATCCECSGLWGYSTPLPGEGAGTNAAPMQASLLQHKAHPGMSAETLVVSWMELVTNYTPKKITHDGDKLVAISSLARYVGEECLKADGPDYLAGLWRHQLVRQLCWIVVLPPRTNPIDVTRGGYAPPPSQKSYAAKEDGATESSAKGWSRQRVDTGLVDSRTARSPLTSETLTRRVNSAPWTGGLGSKTINFDGGQSSVGQSTSLSNPVGGLDFHLRWNTSRPKSYRAPTWSWASVDTPLQFRTADPWVATRSTQNSDSFIKFRPSITVHDAQSTTLPGQPFGPVSAAFILLEGTLSPVRLRILPQNLPPEAVINHYGSMLPISRPVSKLLVQTTAGRVFLANADVAMHPPTYLDIAGWSCVFHCSSSGTRCASGPECSCRKGFLVEDFYALRIGQKYSKRGQGSLHGGLVIVEEIYMILRKIASAAGTASLTIGTFQRIGLGMHWYFGGEAANYRLFEDGEVMQIRLA